MKQLEEIAKRYVSNQFSGLEQNYEMQEMIFRAEAGFLAGYNEAMRWRDPKEELPENVGLYLCKCEKELGFYFDIVFFNKVWRSNNVIVWRPIE